MGLDGPCKAGVLDFNPRGLKSRRVSCPLGWTTLLYANKQHLLTLNHDSGCETVIKKKHRHLLFKQHTQQEGPVTSATEFLIKHSGCDLQRNHTLLQIRICKK